MRERKEREEGQKDLVEPEKKGGRKKQIEKEN